MPGRGLPLEAGDAVAKAVEIAARPLQRKTEKKSEAAVRLGVQEEAETFF